MLTINAVYKITEWWHYCVISITKLAPNCENAIQSQLLDTDLTVIWSCLVTS